MFRRTINWTAQYKDYYLNAFKELVKGYSFKKAYRDKEYSRQLAEYYKSILTRNVVVVHPFTCILYVYDNKYYKCLIHYFESKCFYYELCESIHALNDEFNKLLINAYDLERIKFN